MKSSFLLLIGGALIVLLVFFYSSSTPNTSSGGTDVESNVKPLNSPSSTSSSSSGRSGASSSEPKTSSDSAAGDNTHAPINASALVGVEVYDMPSQQRKKLPPFLVRRASLKSLLVRWKCSKRKVGPFHVDAPATPWPTCRMLDHDTAGRTFAYLVDRVLCGMPTFFPTIAGAPHLRPRSADSIKMMKKNAGADDTENNKDNINNDDDEDDAAAAAAAQQKAGGGGGGHPQHRPVRIIQVGANTGGNDNDPLVKLIRGGGGFAQALLLEPVPWIFEKLHETYATLGGMVTLVQAAMVGAGDEGPVTFTAPKKSMAKHGPWLHQMGGLSMPKRSIKRLERMKLHREFAPITVAGMTFSTILTKFAPWTQADNADHKSGEDEHGGPGMLLPAPPDIFVVDAEGHDAKMVNQVLDYVQLLDDAGRSDTVRVILYENKHVPKIDNMRLMTRLQKMGYTVTEVYVDTVAVRVGTGPFNETAGGRDYDAWIRRHFWAAEQPGDDFRKRWPACDKSWDVVRIA